MLDHEEKFLFKEEILHLSNALAEPGILDNVEEIRGLTLAVGMCGQGYMLGPGVGKLLTRMLTDQETDADAATLKELTPCRAFAGAEALK